MRALTPPASRAFGAAVALVLALLMTLTPASLDAQEPAPETMVLEVPDPDSPGLIPGYTNRDLIGERYAVFAGAALCVEGDVPEAGGFTVVIGEPGQPDGCRTPGEIVLLVGTRDGIENGSWTLAPGTTVVFDHVGPVFDRAGYPAFVCSWLDEAGSAAAPACQAYQITWAFSPRGIFADPRVVSAFVSLMDVQQAAYASTDLILDASPTVLLQAAGVMGSNGRTQLTSARDCRVFSGFLEISDEVAATMVRTLGELGIAIPSCERTSDPAQADLLVWAGPTVDTSTTAGDASFLVSTYMPPPSSGTPALSPDAPGPAASGNAGLVAPSDDRGAPVVALLMLALTLAAALGARAVARR